MVVSEVIPGRSISAVILARISPRAFGEVGSPSLPMLFTVARFQKARAFIVHPLYHSEGTGDWGLGTGDCGWLLVAGCWLLVTGDWLLVTGDWPSAFCLLLSAFCFLSPASCCLPPAACLLLPASWSHGFLAVTVRQGRHQSRLM